MTGHFSFAARMRAHLLRRRVRRLRL